MRAQMLFSALCRFAACHLLATRVESHPDPNYTGMYADLTDIRQQSEVPAKCFFVASTQGLVRRGRHQYRYQYHYQYR